MARFHSAHDLATALRPSSPVLCIRPHAATRAARWFVANFPGKSFYAVKANPSPWLIQALIDGGINQFDVASINEVRLLSDLAPDGELAFLHPVKSREAIREAYFAHGVRIFALDTQEELDKILEATDRADDLVLFVRLSVSSALAKISLSSKFGIEIGPDEQLLQRARQYAKKLGISFHVGSQAMSPAAYTEALERCQDAILRSGVFVEIIDIGGGFPSTYPGMQAPPLEEYLIEINKSFAKLTASGNCEFWCEPGRALSAEAASLVVRIEARKGNVLYLNDGFYGSLYDAGALAWMYPSQVLNDRTGENIPFSAYGPTCDDHDYLPGPFYLPSDIQEGDHIEIGMLGAYSTSMATNFNGFGQHKEIIVGNEPMMSMYQGLLDSVSTSDVADFVRGK